MIDWIYLDWRKYLYIDIKNPKKTINKLKGIFKPLKCYFKFDVRTPYPVLWVSKPAYIHIMFHDVTWKDKFDTPRYEVPPYIWIHLFKLNFLWYWNLPDTIEYNLKSDYIDDYWEQALWYLYYYNTYSQGLLDEPNIEKARESWPWQDTHNNSSWNNKFLMK
jgi:hypothetical protein